MYYQPVITNTAIIIDLQKRCSFCKRIFTFHISRKDTAKFCSYDCYWKNGRQTLKCVICNKKFVISKKWGKRLYCSHKCHGVQMAKIRTGVKTGIIPPNAFKKGMIPWNKGIKIWDSRKHPFLGKKRLNMSGQNHFNWRGDKTNKMKRVRSSFEYKQWRKSVFERDKYICVICGNKSSKNNRVYLQADHIKPFCIYPNSRLDIKNGRTLCLNCHQKTTTYKNGSLGRNERGQFYSLSNQT